LAPSTGADVVVDVTGKVRTPGLVTLPAGSRVADALDAAGGLRPGTRSRGLNLARPLVDGEQILVGVRPAPWPQQPAPTGGSAVPGAPVPPAPVDLNTATLEQLDVLPGIGPVTAQAILDWRAAHGAFTSVDELLEVDGIGDVTLADIRDLVTV
jgi:competence protein ComEA